MPSKVLFVGRQEKVTTAAVRSAVRSARKNCNRWKQQMS